MKLVPLANKVIVEPIEEKTKGGIVLPETAKEKPQEGRVMATGAGKYIGGKKIPLEVKVGDRVLFKKYGPDEVKIEGKEYYILEEEDILAIIK